MVKNKTHSTTMFFLFLFLSVFPRLVFLFFSASTRGPFERWPLHRGLAGDDGGDGDQRLDPHQAAADLGGAWGWVGGCPGFGVFYIVLLFFCFLGIKLFL